MRVTLLLGVLTIGCLLGPAGSQAESLVPADLTNFTQLNRLSVEQSALGRSVRVRAQVLCYDAAWGQLYFHDGQEAKWFSPTLFPRAFEPGDIVGIQATTDSPDGSAGLTNLQAKVQGHGELPAAVQRRPPDLSTD